MFQKIRKYLAFLIVFAFSTVSLTDLGVFIEDGVLEAALVERTDLALSDEDCGVENIGQDDPTYISVLEDCKETKEDCKVDEYLEPDADEWSSTEIILNESSDQEKLLDTSLEFVSFYVHKYQKLPPVYVTKKEASQLGWIGGGLGAVPDNKSIGGDYFGNYQGLLPHKTGRSYYECDIDALGSQNRGKKRLVYSNDGLVYYTEDHYETFQLLYSQWDSENLQIL